MHTCWMVKSATTVVTAPCIYVYINLAMFSNVFFRRHWLPQGSKRESSIERKINCKVIFMPIVIVKSENSYL